LYDPIPRSTNSLERVFEGLFLFLKAEMQYHENRDLDRTAWRRLSDISPQPSLDESDSAVYVCTQAEAISLNIPVSTQSMTARRLSMLTTLQRQSVEGC
jgi:hypothetical protein